MEYTKQNIILFILIFIFLLISIILIPKYTSSFQWPTYYLSNANNLKTIKDSESISNDSSYKSHVLLFYTYASSHKFAYGNLKYFIENAVRERDGVDYIFFLQQVNGKDVNETELPPIPKSNAYYIHHENRCFDYGTVGWFLSRYTIGNPWKTEKSVTDSTVHERLNRKLDITQYKYFIFMNASVRGPYFPPYFLQVLSEYNKSFFWYHVFTKRINDKVKLVGCTISCAQTVHVQSYFVTTDFTGFSIFLKTGGKDGMHSHGIFGCYAALSDTIEISELPMSKRILESGYLLDCLLTKYQTIFSTNKTLLRCPVLGNPYTDKNIDGYSLEPYEVVFVKFNDKEGTREPRERGLLYQRWMESVKPDNRTSW